MAPFVPVLGRLRDERRLHNTAWHASYDYLYHEHHERKRRIYKHITSNMRRRFAGTALPYTSGQGLGDLHNMLSQGHLRPGSPSVYWTDGAGRSLEESQYGIMASAVAFQDGSIWKTEATLHSRYTGLSIDAELHDVQIAFDVIHRLVFVESRNLDNFVIFTDCQDLVRMLAGEAICRSALGSIPTDGLWALEAMYDAVELLASVGKKVVVAWVKGHKGGLGREGNRRANRAATTEVDENIASLPSITDYHLPEWVAGLEGDVKEEALWRLSQPFFRWGARTCWVASTLQ